MTKKIIFLLCAVLLVLSANAKDNVVQQVLNGYNTQWQQIGMEGKIKMQGIPMGIKPSVKVYMVRDNVIRISVRAPLMGEVAVIEIDNDRILGVNKMKDKYSEIPMSTVTRVSGMNLSNIQDLLLAQIFCTGYTTPKPAMFTTVNNAQANMTAILPVVQDPTFKYGFVVDKNLSLICTMFAMDMGTLTIDYTYSKNNAIEAVLQMVMGDKAMDATLEISKINYKPSVINPFVLTSKYKKVPITQLM